METKRFIKQVLKEKEEFEGGGGRFVPFLSPQALPDSILFLDQERGECILKVQERERERKGEKGRERERKGEKERERENDLKSLSLSQQPTQFCKNFPPQKIVIFY
jgi:hypothetical protein